MFREKLGPYFGFIESNVRVFEVFRIGSLGTAWAIRCGFWIRQRIHPLVNRELANSLLHNYKKLAPMSRFGLDLLGREEPPPGYHTDSENRRIHGIGQAPEVDVG